jgi:peptidoglycan/LPS O-acetylase OafA/YrhL
MKLEQAFDPRNNSLNFFRLLLAAEVMLWHSFPITGRMPPAAILQIMFSVGVDGFFAISGFLISRSWLTNPRLREYLVARALRILPGFYVCLIATAFVFAPIFLVIKGGSVSNLLTSAAPFEYVLKNIGIVYIQHDIGGTPYGVPNMHGGWNASLWSLIWEVLCYLVVAFLGVVGLATRRWVSPVILALAVVGALLFPPLTFPGVWTIPQLLFRSAIMFAAGACMYHWRDVIPARWSLVAVSVVIVVAAGLLPDYRVVAALPLAYAVIVSGSLIRNRRLQLRTDVSYGLYIYAFPTQQLLAAAGLVFLGPILFFVVSATVALPIAALSWFAVEKPAMALKRRLRRKDVDSAESRAGDDAPAGEAEPRSG